ncbi:Wadjet anti-phage system protein JetD domain-containing protein [Myxococcus sp. 1LA]
MARKLLLPNDLAANLRKRYASQHRRWLVGGGVWPMSTLLGAPTERDVAADPASVREWIEAWSRWSGGGELTWIEVQWQKLGRQRLPSRIDLASPAEIARIADEESRFVRAAARYDEFTGRWSQLRGLDALARYFDVFADYADVDFRRLLEVLSWLVENPRSGLFLRQLPVEGLDTKWVDSGRRTLVADLLRAVRGNDAAGDFFDVCGIRRPPHRVRIRVLCLELRRAIGGLRDVEAPIEELAALPLAPSRVLVVENLECGLALPDIAGCVAFMKLGASVKPLSTIPWLSGAPVVYWGDIDTHGLAILDRARATLGDVTSVLMDEATLLAHRNLWSEEPAQHGAASLPELTDAERRMFERLRANAWGRNVRLEQERIPWSEAVAAVVHACETP